MEEREYLNLVKKIMDNGDIRETRNSKTISLFGEHLEFDLSKGHIPMLTTKKVSLKNVFYELKFFLTGETDTKHLEKVNVNIWKGNTSKEFLDSRNLDYREGVYGPAYGFQWNHFGAEYNGPDEDYTGKGVNQIDECIDMIKNNPTSRRILFSAWNPKDLPKMSLPPCHLMFQFYVRNGKYLDGQLYQRSADIMLGVPYNILSYSLLLIMVARYTGLNPGTLKMCFGDIHIYSEHLVGAVEQLRRNPTAFPSIDFKNSPDTPIRGYNLDDITITDYNPQSLIKMKMVA